MKLGMVSLGCPKNLVDAEVMLGLLQGGNWEFTRDQREAELIIVNTCGFIESAKEEAVNTILEMAELKKTAKCRYLVMTGCLAQRYAEELFTEIPELDGIVGTECYTDIAYALDRMLRGERVFYLHPRTDKETGMPRLVTTPGHYAYLKIAEGCDNCCSYCVIPQIRGPYRSRPYEDVLAEAKMLAERGIKELIVVAQDTTRYGEDLYGKLLLPHLLRDLSELPDLQWIRVMYMYPNNFTDELIEAFATLPKVCKYVDIPLQHASDRLLGEMNRHDTKAEVSALLTKLRQRIPGVIIRTTFIVGFPGETEEDFRELCEFVREQKFENAGVFKYSKEEGTVAGNMPNQIAEDVKEARFDELMAIQAKISEHYHRQQEGQVLDVIVEGYDEDEADLAFGRSYREAPDIDGTIFIEGAKNLQIGQTVKVELQQGFTYETVGMVVEN